MWYIEFKDILQFSGHLSKSVHVFVHCTNHYTVINDDIKGIADARWNFCNIFKLIMSFTNYVAYIWQKYIAVTLQKCIQCFSDFSPFYQNTKGAFVYEVRQSTHHHLCVKHLLVMSYKLHYNSPFRYDIHTHTRILFP